MKTLLLVGIGAGDPDYITQQAIKGDDCPPFNNRPPCRSPLAGEPAHRLLIAGKPAPTGL